VQPEGAAHASAAAAPKEAQGESVEERLEVAEHRIAEQAQTKVEASQKLPIQMNGMLLFNSFWNGNAGPASYTNTPNYFVSGPASAGGTIRQSLLGFDFNGPTVLDGGKVTGQLSLDFFGGANPLYGEPRIRRGVISIDWQDRSFLAGQDRLLVAQRSPTSLAEVSIPALSGAGNLWIWVPQARYEERRQIGSSSGIRVQTSIVQTYERYAQAPGSYTGTLEPARPGGEARVEIWHRWGESNRVELASAVHRSTTHVGGISVPSFLYSFDGLLRPARWLEFTGTYFSGENLGPLSGPALSFVSYEGDAYPLRGEGGWLQSTFFLTRRLSVNAFGGWQATLARPTLIGLQNSTTGFAGNFIYRLGPNVLASAEAGQYRYAFLLGHPLLRNHYDLALAYLF